MQTIRRMVAFPSISIVVILLLYSVDQGKERGESLSVCSIWTILCILITNTWSIYILPLAGKLQELIFHAQHNYVYRQLFYGHNNTSLCVLLPSDLVTSM